MTRIIAVSNQKGGVGKTTTSVNLAAGLAEAGKSVLLVDLDPQGNATSSLGLEKQANDPTSYELLRGDAPLATVVQQIGEQQLFIIPATQELAGAEVELVAEQAREYKLANALKLAAYDFVVIDCPPSLSLLTINALTAAHEVLIPVQAEYFALEGLSQLLHTIQSVKATTNQGLEILGVVLTMYDKRTSLSEQVAQEVRQHFGDKLFSTTIPRNVRLAEAPSFGRTIFEHDKWSKGTKAYKQLAKEVLQRGH